MVNTITIDWSKGTVKAQLAVLAEKMSDAAFEALDEGTDFIVMMMKTLVLVRTGTLQKTCRKERSGKGYRTIVVRAGGYYTNPETGRICDYAHWVEMRSPFVAPSIAMVDNYIKSLIGQRVVEAVST